MGAAPGGTGRATLALGQPYWRSKGLLLGLLQNQSLGFSLVVRTPRTNALFGQVIKLIMAVVQTNYRHGKDRADDGSRRALGELKFGWIREVG